jgi:hypothetical protein
MILSGLYLAWYWFNDIRENYDDEITGNVIGWQESLANWIDGNRGSLAVVFGVVMIAAVSTTIVHRRRHSH